jgi:tetratricopeptide (TPR) repeat protein
VWKTMPVSPFSRGSRPATGHEASGQRNDALREVVLAANADGIDLLRRGKPVPAFEQLKYAEAVLVSNPEISADENELLALTCSNLGCYYRKAGLPRAALQYLGRALKAEKAAESAVSQDACTLATTKLNACAALSGVGRHEEAEKLAVDALQLLAPQDGSTPSREECSLLAVACHNLGAEREHLGRWAPAAIAYRQGAEVARKVLGPKSPLTRTLQDRCAQALSKAERNPFAPRRPNILRRNGPGRPGTRFQTTSNRQQVAQWPSQSQPIATQGFSWEVNDLLAGVSGIAAQEGQGEDMGINTDASPTHSEATRLEEHGGGGGQPEMEEEAVDDEDEYANEMRARFLPNLAQTEAASRPRNVSIMEQTWPTSSPAVRRWSTSPEGQHSGVVKGTHQHTQQTSQSQRYTHGGALHLGKFAEQDMEREWPSQSPHSTPRQTAAGAQLSSQAHRGSRGRSASTMVSSTDASGRWRAYSGEQEVSGRVSGRWRAESEPY